MKRLLFILLVLSLASATEAQPVHLVANTGAHEAGGGGGGGGGGGPILDAMTEWWDLQSCSGEFDDGEIAGVDLVFGSTTGADSNDPTCGAGGLSFVTANVEYAEAASGEPNTGNGSWTVFAVVTVPDVTADNTIWSWGNNAVGELVQIHTRDSDFRMDVRGSTATTNADILTSATQMHVTVVFDGTGAEVYTDGTTTSEFVWVTTLGTVSGVPFRLGASIRGEAHPATMTVAIAGYVDSALTSTQVADLDAELATLLP